MSKYPTTLFLRVVLVLFLQTENITPISGFVLSNSPKTGTAKFACTLPNDQRHSPFSNPYTNTNNSKETSSSNAKTRSIRQWKRRFWQQWHQKIEHLPKSAQHKGFTSHVTAPPLATTDITTNHYVISHTILLQNELQCKNYICGPLDVTYTNDSKTIEKWLRENVHPMNKGDQFSFVGLDVESVPIWRGKPSFQNGPATIQISTPYSALVIHLTERRKSKNELSSNSAASPCTTTKLLQQKVSSPPPHPSCCSCSAVLQEFLADPTVLKVGADIDKDALSLYQYNPKLVVKSRFDVGGIGIGSTTKTNANNFRNNNNHNNHPQRIGLEKLVRAAVGVELSKNKQISMSDWSQFPLSGNQLSYASRDAWAGAAILANLAETYPDIWDVNAIGKLVSENEMDIEKVFARREIRSWARRECKDLVRRCRSSNEEEEKDKHNRESRCAYDNSRKDCAGSFSSSKNPIANAGKLNPLVHRQEEEEEMIATLMETSNKSGEKLKERRQKLNMIIANTAPDNAPFFDPNVWGLDFSFI